MERYPVLDTVATGARIRELRNANALTVEQVRDFLGLESTQAIYKWQRGDSMPTIDNLYALSSLFQTSVDDILRGDKNYEEEAERASSFFRVPSMSLILLVQVQSRVFTAKCSEPQVGISNGMDGGSGVAKSLSLRTET